MQTPDVTKVQGGAAATFAALVLAAPQAGYENGQLTAVVVVAGVVAAVAIYADAIIRRARNEVRQMEAITIVNAEARRASEAEA